MRKSSSITNSLIYSILSRQANSSAPKAVDIQAMIEIELFEMMMLLMDYSVEDIENAYKVVLQNPDIGEDIKTVIKKNITMNYQTRKIRK